MARRRGQGSAEKIRDGLEKLPEFTEQNIPPVFDAIIKEAGLKMLNLAQPVRVAMTGTTVSPGIYEVLSILGKERVMARIGQAISSQP